jgi:hypothetical protein
LSIVLADLSGLTSVGANSNEGRIMLEGLTPPTRLASCKVRDLLETLEPKDQEILKTAHLTQLGHI